MKTTPQNNGGPLVAIQEQMIREASGHVIDLEADRGARRDVYRSNFDSIKCDRSRIKVCHLNIYTVGGCDYSSTKF